MESEPDSDVVLPSASRVAKRGCILYAVATRAMFETITDPKEAEYSRTNLMEWLSRLDVEEELEPQERRMLDSKVGTIVERARITCSWLYEAAAVLGWALGRIELPPVDVQVSDEVVGNCWVDFNPHSPSTLRPEDTLRAFDELMYNLHWRTSHELHSPGPQDLRRMLADAVVVPGASPVTFAQDDLAVGTVPLHLESGARKKEVNSIVSERRHAASWLCGDHITYSEVSLDT